MFATIKLDAYDRSTEMIDERKQHLELVAAGLMQAYYSVPRSGSPDHREYLKPISFCSMP